MVQRRASRRGSGMLGGIILILVGIWFLLDSLNFRLPGISDLWPLFPMFGGLTLIAGYYWGERADAGVLIPGVGGFLIGLFFILITVGPLKWSDMGELWPVFPLIGGVTFTTVWWVSGRRDTGLLVPAAAGLLVGVAGLLFTHDIINMPLVSYTWPVVLIGIGAWLLFKSYRRGEG